MLRILAALTAAISLGAFTLAQPLYAEVIAAQPDPVKSIKLDDQTEIRKAAQGAYVVTHSFPWPSNSIVLVMKNGEIVLLDTPYTPEATERLLKWLDKRFTHPKITAINSHYHIDRLGGNAALLARGIPVYGSDHTVKLLDERWNKVMQQMSGWISDPNIKAYYRTMKFAKPDHIFSESEGITLRFGEEMIEVSYPGPGHTPDNLVVYSPSHRLLFGGCMIIGGEKLENTTEADLAAWAKSIEKLSRYDAAVVVPGHGGELDRYAPELIKRTQLLVEKAVRRD